MSSFASPIETLNGERIRSFVWPREHGAWGMLLVPLVTGAWIARPGGHAIAPLFLFAVAALAVFCLRTPLETWLETSPLRAQTPAEKRAVSQSIVFYATVAALAVAALLLWARAYGLLVLGAVVVAAFAAQAILRELGRGTRLAAQLIAALGLTSTAAGAYYLVTARWDSTAVTLWAANWLFAANQIHFVQLRIHSARAATRTEKLVRGRGFLIGEILTGVVLWLAWDAGTLPGLASLAFAPVLVRGVVWFLLPAPTLLEIRRLGLSELVHALVFGVLFILAFQLPKG